MTLVNTGTNFDRQSTLNIYRNSSLDFNISILANWIFMQVIKQPQNGRSLPSTQRHVFGSKLQKSISATIVTTGMHGYLQNIYN